jgi:hypothetical protein
MLSLGENKIMKSKIIITVSLFAALFITSCDWHTPHTVVGSGPVETMEVMVADFTGVSVTGTCNVEIEVGEPRSVELSAQSQVLDVMTYEVRSGILHIGFRPEYSINTSKDISAYIVLPELDFIAITGAGSFEIRGEEQDFLDIYITGTGDVNAFDMEVDECNIRIEGAGNCEVNVSSNLDVQISGVGNVTYMGHPSLTSDISGVGNVTAINK